MVVMESIWISWTSSARMEEDEVKCMQVWDALFYMIKKASLSRHLSLDLVDTSGVD